VFPYCQDTRVVGPSITLRSVPDHIDRMNMVLGRYHICYKHHLMPMDLHSGILSHNVSKDPYSVHLDLVACRCYFHSSKR